MNIEFKIGDVVFWSLSEAALFAFFYYLLFLLKAEGNIWLNTAVLFALINIAIIFCPVVRKCYK